MDGVEEWESCCITEVTRIRSGLGSLYMCWGRISRVNQELQGRSGLGGTGGPKIAVWLKPGEWGGYQF